VVIRGHSCVLLDKTLEIPSAQKLHILSSPAAGWRSILIGQNVDFEFLIAGVKN
jgi:hypothetical protein